MEKSLKTAAPSLLGGLVGAVTAVLGCGGAVSPIGHADDGGADSADGTGGAMSGSPLVISTATRTPRTSTWSVNYWMWPPTYGDDVAGTEPLVLPLAASIMRIGGYNNDANTPDPFDDSELDKAVAYARAIGAQPLIQVPHLADIDGLPPTADEAAAMVRYANVTMGYGIKYFSVGNEPDIYATQGSLTDSTQPAIPGYTPADFCASAETYVAAMKAVDPTIQIVGPDLAYRYQPGNDWLTPILQTCGDLFDIVSIHRYPFEAAQATLTAAAADAASFRDVITSVRGILQATGNAAKPLALTEMNIVYDATTCVLDASPRTMGSALWMADSLGTAIESRLWTSAVWDISDDDGYALGLIGPAPAHTPRPEYYAYQLYADHFGPTLVDVTTLPAGVSAHASRNSADDATEVIVVNWNAAPVALAFQVTGLAVAPPATTYVLPAVSMAAVEIGDDRPASAWSYGDAQRRSGSPPELLAPGVGPTEVTDGGAEDDAGVVVGSGCGDGGGICSEVVLPTPAITTGGRASEATLLYGSGEDQWDSYTYAGNGQTEPTAAVTADGNGIQISGGFAPPIESNGDYLGVGLYFDGSSCVDASAYTGVKFDFSGDLGGCTLAFAASFFGDLSSANGGKGGCSGASSICYGPLASVSPGATTVLVPFASLGGGMPIAGLDPTTLVTVEWQLGAPIGEDGGGCVANFAVENVSFY
jgi:hypothetical protein